PVKSAQHLQPRNRRGLAVVVALSIQSEAPDQPVLDNIGSSPAPLQRPPGRRAEGGHMSKATGVHLESVVKPRRHGTLRLGALAGACAAILCADHAAAQRLEEVVVTARFREESLQEIPLAISAITAETLQANGATN